MALGDTIPPMMCYEVHDGTWTAQKHMYDISIEAGGEKKKKNCLAL